MRIQIDTKEKTITILNRVNFAELTDALEKLLGDSYFDYDIDVNHTYIPWINPITYDYGTGSAPQTWVTTPGTYNFDIVV